MTTKDIEIAIQLIQMLENDSEEKYEIMFECRRIKKLLEKEKIISA